MMETKILKNFIGGEHVEASNGRTYELVNPATGQTFAEAPVSEQADVDWAFEAADNAFETWRDTTPSERQLALLSPNGFPVFSDSARTNSLARSSIASASLKSASCLSEGVVSRHVSKAFSAASKARSISSRSEMGACANVWPVAGLIRS